jgi:hypothetical protein
MSLEVAGRNADHDAMSGALTLRLAQPEDALALLYLAELDSAAALTGSVLLAERDGRVLAARSLDSGATIADPFAPTADVVDLLAVRARTLHGARIPRRRLRPLAA